MFFIFNDGGRAKAGYRGNARDCACRAIAIATDTPYSDVYERINAAAKKERRKNNRSSARTGVHSDTMKKLMAEIGWAWTPTMGIGTGCAVHLSADELPTGKLIARVSRHYVAVIDGCIYDTHDSSRNGTRCVYGYWTPLPEEA